MIARVFVWLFALTLVVLIVVAITPRHHDTEARVIADPPPVTYAALLSKLTETQALEEQIDRKLTTLVAIEEQLRKAQQAQR